MSKIYQYDPLGYFIKESDARQDPLDQDRFLVPRSSTTKKPSDSLFQEGKKVRFVNNSWISEDIEEEARPTLQEVKDSKKNIVKYYRDSHFSKLLFYKTVSGTDLYLKPKPQGNIFLSALAMAENSTKEWYPCDIDGVQQNSIQDISKTELLTIAAHYENRKTSYYNLYNQMCFEIDDLPDSEAVENYDISDIT